MLTTGQSITKAYWIVSKSFCFMFRLPNHVSPFCFLEKKKHVTFLKDPQLYSHL
jgi:hypothetical protein